MKELLDLVDFVLLETNDGNLHLEQAVEVFKAGKPVFIDKPIAANLADAIAIFDLAEKYNVPMFSASSLRFSHQTQKARNGEFGEILGADTYSPAKLEPSHTDLSWYAIHGIESLFAVMGVGCESIQRTYTEGSEFIVGKWKDGRIGTMRGIREGKSQYGGRALTKTGFVDVGSYDGYDVLLKEIIQFFETGISPIPREETLEIFAFIEAADESRKKDGQPINIQKVMKKGIKDAKKICKKLKY